jgi:hypothetical protein
MIERARAEARRQGGEHLFERDRGLVLALLRSARGDLRGNSRAKAILAAAKCAAQEEKIRTAMQIIRELKPDIDHRSKSV